MVNKKIIFLFFLLYISSIWFLFLAKKNQGNLAGLSTNKTVEVTLSIGDHRFTLYGYTSPYALVTFSGLGIFDQTRADENGYFVFNNRFSPFSPKEACLTAQDQMGRLTSEVCLPPFPTNYNAKIGPVIMPPSLSLDKENYWLGDEIVLSGQTIPNSHINLSFFTEKTLISEINNLSQRFLPVKKTFASALPLLEAKADEKGNFALFLPSSSAQKYRLFSQVDYQGEKSSESRKLTVKILPRWMIIFKIFGIIISLIKSRLLEIIILAEIIGLLTYLYHSYLHPKQLAIVKWEKKEIIKKWA